MAKIKWGLVVTDGRGKLGGQVLSKNRAGSYVRTKVTPSNPQTVAQNLVRSRLTGFSQGWRGLTEAARNSWNAAVGSFPKNNVFGDSVTLSGAQLYIGLNAQLAAAGQTAIGTPPVPTGAAALLTLSGAASLGGTSFDVTFTPDPVPSGMTMIIEATAQVSAGKSNLKSLYRQIATEAAAAASPSDIYAAYIAKFGTLIVGQKVGLRAKLVNNTTGEVSGALTAVVIVAA